MTRSTRRPLLLLTLALPLCLSASPAGSGDLGAAASAQDAGVCEPGVSDPTAELNARLARAATQGAAARAAGDVIVLNGQGYNYGASGGRDFDQLREELRRQAEPAN